MSENQDYTKVMSAVADSTLTKDSFSDAFTSNNQAKMFLVAQAKNEMQRIIKLTKFLDVVEEKFMDTAQLLMNEYPDNLAIVQDTLDTIMKCLNRSNDLIMAIVKDDKLNSFVFKDDAADIVYEYKDITPASKETIRAFASNMLDRLHKLNSFEAGDSTDDNT